MRPAQRRHRPQNPVVNPPLILGSAYGKHRAPQERLDIPDDARRLRLEIHPITGAVELNGRGEHPSVALGGDHGGFHPHLGHEFVHIVGQDGARAIDAIKATDGWAPGGCAHESAMRYGAQVIIPSFA